jgi:hypothetical protein
LPNVGKYYKAGTCIKSRHLKQEKNLNNKRLRAIGIQETLVISITMLSMTNYRFLYRLYCNIY